MANSASGAAIGSLKNSSDFNALKKEGKSIRPSAWILVRWRFNELNETRLGCTFPRYVGSAVVRNRLRRWAKEYFRAWAKGLKNSKGIDLNIVLLRNEKAFYKDMKHEEFDQQLSKVGRRLAHAG